MADYFQQLKEALQQHCQEWIVEIKLLDCVTVEVKPDCLLELAKCLRDNELFQFTTLLDVCGVDYLEYGQTEWRTRDATSEGYSRGVSEGKKKQVIPWDKPRFAAVYHLLSMPLNRRLRLKAYLQPEPKIASVNSIWPSANWYEREAFDLFGIVFEGHPDLRRILTDYGFKGHPFRKDFPLVGEVEMRYDAATEQCIYEPVSIKERVLVPKVIRDDHRYMSPQSVEEDSNG